MDKSFLQHMKVVSKKSLLTSVVGSAFLFSGSAWAVTDLTAPGQVDNALATSNLGDGLSRVLGTTTMAGGSALTFDTANSSLIIGENGSLSANADNTVPLILSDNILNVLLENNGTLNNDGNFIDISAAGNAGATSFNIENIGTTIGNLGNAHVSALLTLDIKMGDGSSDATPRFVGTINSANLANASAFTIKNNFDTEGTIDGNFTLSVPVSNAGVAPIFNIKNNVGSTVALRSFSSSSGTTTNVNADFIANAAASTITGTLNVNSGTTTLANSTFHTNTTTVANGATLGVGTASFNNGTLDVSGAVTAAAATNLDNGVLVLNSGGSFTAAAAATTVNTGEIDFNGGTFNTGGNAVDTAFASPYTVKLMASSTVNGVGGFNLNHAGNGINNGSFFIPSIGASEPTLNMTNAANSDFAGVQTKVLVDGYVPNGKVYTVVTSDANLTGALGAVTLDASSVDTDVSFAAGGANGTSTMTLTATRNKTLSEKASAPELKDLSDGLDVAAVNNSDVREILSEAIKFSGDDLRDGFEQFVPDKAGGAHAGALVGNDGVTNAGFMHLAEVRDGASYAAGQPSSHLAGWVKMFGASAEQKRRKGVEGYDAGTFGLSFGLDKEMSRNFLLGLGLGYAYTEVESRLTSGSKVDVKSWQGTLYGSYMRGNMFMDGALSYAGNQFDRERNVNVGAVSQLYKAEHDGHQLAAKVLAGVKMGSRVNVTPKFGLSYVKSKQDAYTETTDVRLNSALNVSDSTVDMFKGRFGVEFSKAMRTKDGGMSTPKLELAVLHDFTGDENVATYNFINNSPSFKVTGPSPARTSFMVSLGWKYASGHKEFGVNYDFETKDKYQSHSGMAAFRYKW